MNMSTMAVEPVQQADFNVHEFGARVTKARTAMSLTQLDVAGMAGFHRSFLGRMESGIHAPSFAHVLALARSLDVSIAYLAGWKSEFGSYEGPLEV